MACTFKLLTLSLALLLFGGVSAVSVAHADPKPATAAPAVFTPAVTPAQTAAGRPDFGTTSNGGGTDAESLANLTAIKKAGFRHISVSSWMWTIPSKGSPLRDRMNYILNWCDHNDMGVWLLTNIQYGDPGECGDFDQDIKDPLGVVRPYVADWIDTFKGHPCVRGFQLGNEVGPGVAQDVKRFPIYTKAFHDWLGQRYGTIGALNAAWGTQFADFEAVGLPKGNEPGFIDLQRFGDKQFGAFYSAVFDGLYKPVFGNNIGYASKTGADPYIYANYPGATVQAWDDDVANYPLYSLRALADCDPRPAYDSELHLYADAYNYFASIPRTRYRYFTDAVTGEWMNTQWGAYSRPDLMAIAATVPGDLADVLRLSPQLKLFNAATRKARIGVLITQPLDDETGGNIRTQPPAGVPRPLPPSPKHGPVPLEDAYAAMGATGRDWRYILDRNLPSQAGKIDALIVPATASIPVDTIHKIVALPKNVRVEWGGKWPVTTEYGQPLPPTALASLMRRCHPNADIYAAANRFTDQRLPKFYRKTTLVDYWDWAPATSYYPYAVNYPYIEARQATGTNNVKYVLLINHDQKEITISAVTALPWYDPSQKVVDMTSSQPVVLEPTDMVVLHSLDIRILRYQKK